MPVVHLIHGFLGSGKTTFSLQLAEETGALRFSPDERMSLLHGDDPPANHFAHYHAAILAQMHTEWTRSVQNGRDVILDYGFWSRAAREAAVSLGATCQLYAVQCPESTARERIRLRNTHLRGSLYIADATYDILHLRFEPLDPDELHMTIESTA